MDVGATRLDMEKIGKRAVVGVAIVATAFLVFSVYKGLRNPACRDITRVSIVKENFNEVWLLQDCEGTVHAKLERTVERPVQAPSP